MQLLSVPYSCALVTRHYNPVPSISFRSSFLSPSSSQCRLGDGPLCCFNSRTNLREARRVYAQSQEGVENETLNVTDLRDVSESSDSPAEQSWQGGLSEEDAREALNFEQGAFSLCCNLFYIVFGEYTYMRADNWIHIPICRSVCQINVGLVTELY